MASTRNLGRISFRGTSLYQSLFVQREFNNAFWIIVIFLSLVIAGCASDASPRKSNVPMSKSDSTPIACTLSPDQLKSRRNELLPGLIKRASEVTDLENGIQMRFESSAGLLAELVQVIDQERTCCSFLRFKLTIEPATGPITFEVTGPPGTRELLRAL